MSGIEFYNHIKKIARSLVDRVVFVTGDVMGADTMKFLEMTRAPYIAKPFDAGQVRKKLKSLLQ
jgi:DNA-binding response OmpR family regulator